MRIERSLAVSALLLLAAAACDSSSGYLGQEGRRQRLSKLGAEPFDSTGTYALQGVSTLHRVTVQKLDPRELGADTLERAYRLFRERCGACHDVPAPSSKTASLWDATLARMKTDAAEAGLMPWSASDEAAIRAFLRDHASDRR